MMTHSRAPPLAHRWLHTSGNGKDWSAFGATDSRALERAWQHVRHDEELREAIEEATRDRREKEQQQREREKEKAARNDSDNVSIQSNSKPSSVNQAEPKEFKFKLDPPDPFTPLPPWRVPVGQDHLYEVDLRSQKLYPVFWKQGTGSKVMRGTWFTESSSLSPLDTQLADELESYYQELQPWLPSYADELRSAVTLGADAEDKLKRPLVNSKGYVIMLGPHLARIYTQDFTNRLAKSVLTAWSGEHSGGQLVIRGFDTAKRSLQANADDDSKRKGSSKDSKKAASSSSSNKTGQRSPSSSGASTPARSRSAQGTDSSSGGSGSSAKPVEISASLELLRSITAKLGPLPPRRPGASSSFSSNTAKPTSGSGSDSPTSREREAALSGMLSSGLEEDAAAAADGHDKDGEGGKNNNSTTTSSQAKPAGAELSEGNEADELEREESQARQPVDLVLILHGIGQKYAAETNPSLDFTIAVNKFRELVHKQAEAPPPSTVGGGGFAQMMGGRRVQFLPVMWRAALEDFEPEAAHEANEELNNHFTLDEVFGDRNSIPIVRKLISGVLLDIPLYLSRHRKEIIRRVIGEANKMYRLFCQRNPDFEEQGSRTHWIAHSLGAALAFDILSSQPTHVESLAQIPRTNNHHLHFNVGTLILAGSPAALFMWLAKSQLIARRGRRGSVGGDDCVDKHEEYLGCLAVDRIANIFSLSDPVGTRLTPCVGSEYAATLGNVSLTTATTAILRSLPGGLDTPLPNNSGFFSSWGRSAGRRASVAAAADEEEGGGGGEGDEADLGEGELFGDKKRRNRNSMSGAASVNTDGSGAEDRAASWFLRLSARKGGAAAAGGQKRPSSAGSGSTVGPDDWERVRRDSTPSAKGRVKYGESNGGAAEMGEGGGGGGKDDAEKPRSEGEEEDPHSSSDDSDESHKLQKASRKATSTFERERGRRRVQALNQLGTLDFTIPIASSLLSNQYLDMLYSHASYWQLPSFADAVLAFVFASDETLAAARGHLFK
ncbi:hypothetical protein V8E36_007889 [Tilletia maclaganii]